MNPTHIESTPALENWLSRATCRLSGESRNRVRSEILEHYEAC